MTEHFIKVQDMRNVLRVWFKISIICGQDTSKYKGICHGAWWSEFKPCNLWCRRQTSALLKCFLNCMYVTTYTPTSTLMYRHTDKVKHYSSNSLGKIELQIQQHFFPFGERQLNFGCNLILLSGSSQCGINVAMIRESVYKV